MQLCCEKNEHRGQDVSMSEVRKQVECPMLKWPIFGENQGPAGGFHEGDAQKTRRTQFLATKASSIGGRL